MDIVIHIDKYRAAKRISGAYLTHNSDIRIVVSADPESGFDLSQPTSMIVVTARGEYPPITASGGVFAAPLLTREDLPEGVRVGFTQGSVRTTRGANMDLIRTISDHPGASADPHADEYDRVISEITLADKLLVERASDGYRGAALISALIEYLTEGDDNIFIAEYDVTTTAEIGAAISAGKTVFVHATTSGEDVLAFMTHATPTYKFYAQLSYQREVTVTLTSSGEWDLEVVASDRVFTVIYGRTTWAALLEYWHNGGGTRISLLDTRRGPSHQYYGWLSEIYPNEGYARFDAFDTENNAIHHYTLESDNTWSVETVAYTTDISLAEIAAIIDNK